ncbi:MAG: DUF4293 domain-containing protein [Bacteroidales bacterium]|nr:DUF4293 domain-containing protein [Bacteroidales bacterium]
MWQRVQTLYIGLSTALIASMFFCDKAVDTAFTAYWPYTVFLVIITLLNLIALGACKFRIFQVRTVVLAAIITLALQAWLAVDFFVTSNTPAFRIAAVFPIVCVILDVMAARGIWADELIVRSSSRLRAAKRKK